jgi:hypothetical protein
MRIWALASCSGLLALAACSAEQSNPPTSAAPTDGDDRAQVTAQPGMAPSTLSPMAQPEVPPRQPHPGAPQSTLATRPYTRPGQPLSQAAQLQARVQRLQAQHNHSAARQSQTLLSFPMLPQQVAAPAAPKAAPQPVHKLTQQVPQTSAEPPVAATRSIPLPPVPAQPQPSSGPAPGAPEVMEPQASHAAHLGPVARASITQGQPIPRHHQSYRSRRSAPAPVLANPTAPETLPPETITPSPGSTVATSPLWARDAALRPEAAAGPIATPTLSPTTLRPRNTPADRLATASQPSSPPLPLANHQATHSSNLILGAAPVLPVTTAQLPALQRSAPQHQAQDRVVVVSPLHAVTLTQSLEGDATPPLAEISISRGEAESIAPRPPGEHQASTLPGAITITTGASPLPQTSRLCQPVLDAAQTSATAGARVPMGDGSPGVETPDRAEGALPCQAPLPTP